MIRKAEIKDLPVLAELACRLWPDHTPEEMREEYAGIIAKPDAAFFLTWEGENAVGFAQCQLRQDYVEGTDSSPVGYLEGIYVAEGHRNRGIARGLLAACESWAVARGCREFASDCELENTQSLRFHRNVGFAEANRIICFTKKLPHTEAGTATEIRLADRADQQEIIRYDSHIPRDKLGECIRNRLVYVLREEKRIVGILRYSLFWQTAPFLDLLYIDEACRGKGFGRRMMASWESAMGEMGYKYVMLSTQEDETAKYFYEKLGYRRIGAFLPPEQDADEIMYLKML